MNSVGSLIATLDPDFLLLERREQLVLVTAVLLYVFRAIESPELTDHFKEVLAWKGQDCIDFRNVLKGKGYIQKNYKFYLYAVLNGKKVDPEDYEARPDDILLAQKLKAGRTGLAKDLLTYCKGRARVGYAPRTLEAFNKGLARVTPEIEVTCAKAVAKKLQFVWQSGQGNKDELTQELLVNALYAMYRAYPEIDDLLHLKNIGITAIGNRTQNLISEYTTQSRLRLKKEEDGTFSGTTLSMHTMDVDTVFSQDSGSGAGGVMIVCNALMSGLDGSCVEHERPSDVESARDLRAAVDGLFSRMRSERARRFLSILMGVYDPGFSQYLEQPNDEASDKLPYREYCNAARKYLDIPQDRARVFISKLRKELTHFKSVRRIEVTHHNQTFAFTRESEAKAFKDKMGIRE